MLATAVCRYLGMENADFCNPAEPEALIPLDKTEGFFAALAARTNGTKIP